MQLPTNIITQKTALYCIEHVSLGLPLEPPDYSAVINDFDHFIVTSNFCQCRSTSCCLHFTVRMGKSDEQKNTMLVFKGCSQCFLSAFCAVFNNIFAYHFYAILCVNF